MYTGQTISKMLLVLSLLGFLNAECNAETKGPQSTKAITSNQKYVVQPGDIFGKVCQKYQPEGVSLKTVMAAFYTINKSAFKKGDQTKLIVGSTLIVPSAQALGATIPLKIDSQLSAEVSAPLAIKVAVSKDNSSTLSSHANNDATETVADNVKMVSGQNTPQTSSNKANKLDSTWLKNIGIIVVILIAIGAYLRKRKKLIEEQAREVKRLLGWHN